MAPRDSARRFWLVLAYSLATMFAHAEHRHGRAAADPTRCESSCSDPSPHVSGHSAPDLGQDSNDCTACQFRTKHHVLPIAAGTAVPRGCVAVRERLRPAWFSRPLVRLQTRAPPVA